MPLTKPWVSGPLAAALLLFTACSSTNPGAELEEVASAAAPPSAANWAPGGTEAPYCPNVTLREGTAVIDRKAGDRLAYNANITGVNRDCRIVNGQLRMKIAVTGRVMPGPAAPGPVTLPVRVAILRGGDVIYSELGQRQVNLASGQPAQTFEYVDDRIAFAEPSERNIVVYTGFDEGPPEAR